MKKQLLVFSLLLLLTVPATYTLFTLGGFTSHDLVHHVVRQISMDRLLSEGQFPPRWSGDLNNGYGYPVFLFNYPLPAMVGEVFHKFGLGFVDSVKAVLFLSMTISAVGMYLFLNSLLNSRLAAFLGAMFYVYAPLRFLNVYVSAAVGSALALGLVPYVFWSLVEVYRGKKWAVLFGSLGFAGLILAHNVTALIFTPVILAFAVILIWRSKERVWLFRQLVVMFLLGLGLSAWFWMPAVLEKGYTRYDLIFGNFYQDQFVSLGQLLRSPWGYGLSHPQNPEAGDMSYQLGLVQILAMVLLVPVVWIFRKKAQIKTWGIFALVAFITSVFLMLKVSQPLWKSLPFLSLVQFPLRFQAVSVFAASLAAALLTKHLPFRKIVFVILLSLVIYANRNHWHINEEFSPGEDYFLNLKTTSTSYGEHLPKWGAVANSKSPGKFQYVSGQGWVNIRVDKSNYVLAQVGANASSKLVLNQYYFPGWDIEVDGQKVKFDYLTDTKSYGLPVFDLQAGSHIIKAKFKNTLIRNIADFISLIVLAGCVTMILWMLFPFKKFLVKK